MTENNNGQPNPEDMGARLDEEIKETVEDWAEDPEGGDLFERIDVRLRGMVGGWVGAEEDAGWAAIGDKMDTNTRKAFGAWVGAEEDAGWADISGNIESRIRTGIARVFKVKAESGDPQWADITAKWESGMRNFVSALVGADRDASWSDIGQDISDKTRRAFKSLFGGKEEEEAEVRTRSQKVDIEGEEASADDDIPSVQSSKPVD
ncbi:MAG: hypothetical protein GYB65_02370 [Chloroflexi bacterium]|nr:hypothetical protein [Chloroflexota bacterium]